VKTEGDDDNLRGAVSGIMAMRSLAKSNLGLHTHDFCHPAPVARGSYSGRDEPDGPTHALSRFDLPDNRRCLMTLF
jgi:hypothetical protein